MGKANRAYRRRVYQKNLKAYLSGLPLDEIIATYPPPKQPPWWTKITDFFIGLFIKYLSRRG